MEKKTEWTTVSIQKPFKEECEKFLKRHPLYPTFAEFVRDACRRRLDQLKETLEMEEMGEGL